jgi:GTPase SAR1 family protein
VNNGIKGLSIIARYVSKGFSESIDTIVLAAYITIDTGFNNENLQLIFWNIYCQEVYKSLTSMYYRNTADDLLVFVI